MTGVSIYKKTATVSKSGKVFAFGRKAEMDGRDTSLGGYYVFMQKKTYNGQIKGGLDIYWASVAENLTYPQAVETMNTKLGYVAFQGK